MGEVLKMEFEEEIVVMEQMLEEMKHDKQATKTGRDRKWLNDTANKINDLMIREVEQHFQK